MKTSTLNAGRPENLKREKWLELTPNPPFENSAP